MRTVCLGQDAPLDAIAHRVRNAKRVVAVSGAGLSCSAGIPDFRSKDGLYNLVKEEHPDAVVKGQDLFDASLFRSKKTASVFFTFMAKLRAEMAAAEPTPSHHFLRHLGDSDKLLRIYTQNIDGYEARVGLKDKTVMLHGDIHRLRCTTCTEVQEWKEEYRQSLARGKAPYCTECRDMEAARRVVGLRKRHVGVMRPQVVLYNEVHPEAAKIGAAAHTDAKAKPDLLLIMGTSLRVDGIKGLVRDLGKAVRANGGICVFVNATAVSSSMWDDVIDYHVQSGIDEWVADLKVRAPELWLKQSRLEFSAKRKYQGNCESISQRRPQLDSPLSPPDESLEPGLSSSPSSVSVSPEPEPEPECEYEPLIFSRVHLTWPSMCSTRLAMGIPKSDACSQCDTQSETQCETCETQCETHPAGCVDNL